MRISFIGLSSFLIENNQGYRILIDPFNNAPEWSLGVSFPDEFEDKPFGANLVLMSEPDADHAYAPGGWLQEAPPTKPDSNPFPNLNLRVIYEFNGDLNIAWHYSVDGIRLAHFADNAYLLTQEQLQEMGKPDIIFISPPKEPWNENSIVAIRKNIQALSPKIVIWSHHIVPKGMPESDNPEDLRNFFRIFFKDNAATNKAYKGEDSFIELCYILENAIALNKEYSGIVLNDTFLTVESELLTQSSNNPKAILFRSMLAKPKN